MALSSFVESLLKYYASACLCSSVSFSFLIEAIDTLVLQYIVIFLQLKREKLGIYDEIITDINGLLHQEQGGLNGKKDQGASAAPRGSREETQHITMSYGTSHGEAQNGLLRSLEHSHRYHSCSKDNLQREKKSELYVNITSRN